MSRQFLNTTAAILSLLVSSFAGTALADDDIKPDFLMDSDPQLQLPESVVYFHPDLKSLLMTALQRPEADMQRMSAETVARTHELGLQGLSEAIPQLEKIVESEGSHSAARFAAARALIVLNSEASADKLFAASQAHGADLRQLVEPALANWNHAAAKAKWLERLSAKDTTHRDLTLALRGLGETKESTALASVLGFVNNLTQDAGLRLEAAAAAGQIAETGLESAAEKLARDTRAAAFVNQLCAIRLLVRHSSPEATRLLTELSSHQESVVAAESLTRLNEIDSNLVLPLAEAAMKHRDPHVRLQGALAYSKLPMADRIAPLGALLTDINPTIRKSVLESLLKLSETSELHDAICETAMSALGGDKRQREAALLLGIVDHKPAANRLVELLEAENPDVMICAAWALRKLAVPETSVPMLDKAKRQTERRRQENIAGLDEQVAHLFEALGVMKVAEAEPVLRLYVPKDFYSGDRSRGAAIWALGRLKEGVRDEELENELAGRLLDFADQQPEKSLIKQMSVVALVRMKSVEEVDLLRGLVDRMGRPVALAVTLRWGVKELTGEELPAPPADAISPGTWFLEPLK